MFVRFYYFCVKQLCKFIGLPFTFSSDGEDVIIFKYLCKINKGIYIDVGSNLPVKHSNTFLLYLTGWRGVCIDPLPNLRKKYCVIRSRDKFINAGVLRSKSELVKTQTFFYYKKNKDNSTFDTERVKELSEKFSREPSSIIEMPIVSVSNILSAVEDFFIDSKDIGLLNLDIEGFELDILQDFFSCDVYPWVVCVEELGKTADTLKDGEIYKLMIKRGYILGSRTFLSSIYILKEQIGKLPSPYIKELKL